MTFEQCVGVAGEPNRVGAIVLWESRARDDAGFFVHDTLHEPRDRFLFPGAAIQRSVDGHPDTVILDLKSLRSTHGNTARNVKPTAPAGPILFLMAGLSSAEYAQGIVQNVLPRSLTRSIAALHEPLMTRGASRWPHRIG